LKSTLARILTAFLMATPAFAVELKPETAAAFDRYVRAVETRMDDEIRNNEFLALDRLPDASRRAAYDQIRQGQIEIQTLRASENGRPITVPNGMIHHWLGIIFLKGATLPEVLAILQDYDNHQEIYKPRMRRSKLIERNGSDTKIHLQLFNKSVVTVFLNADFDVRDTDYGPARYQIALRSTHIAELVNPDTPGERELLSGNNHGYMLRFASHWRVEEKDDGVYLQNESVALSRAVPTLFARLVNPFIKDLPRDILRHLLTDTRDAVEKARD
jgi:hypothetical protein